jgi:hypothetical protein
VSQKTKKKQLFFLKAPPPFPPQKKQKKQDFVFVQKKQMFLFTGGGKNFVFVQKKVVTKLLVFKNWLFCFVLQIESIRVLPHTSTPEKNRKFYLFQKSQKWKYFWVFLWLMFFNFENYFRFVFFEEHGNKLTVKIWAEAIELWTKLRVKSECLCMCVFQLQTFSLDKFSIPGIRSELFKMLSVYECVIVLVAEMSYTENLGDQLGPSLWAQSEPFSSIHSLGPNLGPSNLSFFLGPQQRKTKVLGPLFFFNGPNG